MTNTNETFTMQPTAELPEKQDESPRQKWEKSLENNDSEAERQLLNALWQKVVQDGEISRLGQLSDEPSEELGGKSPVDVVRSYLEHFSDAFEQAVETYPPQAAIQLVIDAYGKGLITKTRVINSYANLLSKRADEYRENGGDDRLQRKVSNFLQNDVYSKHEEMDTRMNP